MQFAITFTRDAYEQWLRSRNPDHIIGVAPSDSDNPIARFITEQLSLSPEGRLVGVVTHRDGDSPVADLAIHNGFFITRSIDPADRVRATADESVLDLPATLPIWTMPLLVLYSSAEKTNDEYEANRESAVQSRTGAILITARQAIEDATVHIASTAWWPADAALGMLDPPRNTLPDTNHAVPHLELAFEPEEFSSWREHHQGHGAIRMTGEYAEDPLGTYLAYEVDGLREARTYLDHGIPKADLVVFTIEFVRYGGNDEFRSKVYGGVTISVRLPHWTSEMIRRSVPPRGMWWTETEMK